MRNYENDLFGGGRATPTVERTEEIKFACTFQCFVWPVSQEHVADQNFLLKFLVSTRKFTFSGCGFLNKCQKMFYSRLVAYITVLFLNGARTDT